MTSPVAVTGVGKAHSGPTQALSTDDVSYMHFKNTVLALHKQETVGVAEGDYISLETGLRLLREWSGLFPDYAARLADDPEFLS